MAITEINAQLKYRNTSGDTTIMYPITKADNIEGILSAASGGTGNSLGAAPPITYGTEDIVAGSTSDTVDGVLHFVYATSNGVWDHVKSIFISIDGVWRLVWNLSTES